MERIGIRELRQHASKYLERVERGETLEITNRGRLVARILPASQEPMGLEKLRAEGKLIPARGRLRDLPPPLPATPGRPLPSEILEEMRMSERF